MSGKYNIGDHVFFVGKLTTASDCLNEEQKLFLKKYENAIKGIFCAALASQVTFKQDYYQEKYSPIQKEIEKITIYIVLEPIFNAWHDPEKNTINLSLYLLNIFMRLYDFQDLAKAIRNRELTDIDTFYADIYNEHNRKQRLSEFKTILSETPKYEFKTVNDEFHLLWLNWNDYEFKYDDRCVMDSITLIYRHEMMHWHMRRFKESVRKQYIKEATDMLFFCVREYSFADIKKFLSVKTNAVEAWAEEICADFFAFHMTLVLNDSVQKQRDIYLAIAYYYASLHVEELIQNDALNNSQGIKLNESHPPAAVRQLTLMHWLAKDMGMPFEQYMLTSAGAWLHVSIVFNTTITDLMEGIQ